MSKEIQCKCCKEYWWEMNIHSKSGLCPNCYDYVANLEAKLEEKEKEITVLKEVIDKNKTGNFTSENVCNAISKFYEPLLKHLQNQTAIAELEKVKNIIDSKVKNIDKRLDDLDIKIGCESTSMQLNTYKEIVKLIDQQIKELKGDADVH